MVGLTMALAAFACSGPSLAQEGLSVPEDRTLSLPSPIGQGLIDESTFLQQSPSCDSILYSAHDDSHQICHAQTTPWQWTVLPDGLLWHSYLAGLHEPRISTVFLGDDDENGYWDATLGGRVGLLRYGTPQSVGGRGWQWDVEGGVITRLNILESEDVDSMDYRFGTILTTRQGEWGAKLGYFHISSHVGDEYMVRNPTYQRVNYVTESLVGALSYHPNQRWRLYGELAIAVKRSGGAKPLQFQTGFEYIASPKTRTSGSPFTAMNVDLREAVDFDPSVSIQTGWQWQGTYSERRFRTGLQYFHGPSSQFQFLRNVEHHLGFGVWYDY